MKGCGRTTKGMDRELIGSILEASLKENTQETGLKMKGMAEEHFSRPTGTGMMAFGFVESLKEKEEWFMLMKTFMKVNGMKVKEMAMEF